MEFVRLGFLKFLTGNQTEMDEDEKAGIPRGRACC